MDGYRKMDLQSNLFNRRVASGYEIKAERSVLVRTSRMLFSISKIYIKNLLTSVSNPTIASNPSKCSAAVPCMCCLE